MFCQVWIEKRVDVLGDVMLSLAVADVVVVELRPCQDRVRTDTIGLSLQ